MGNIITDWLSGPMNNPVTQNNRGALDYTNATPTGNTYNSGQVNGASTGPDSNQMWNTGWNQGYNNPNSAYSGNDVNAAAGYKIGQQEYFNRNSGSGSGGGTAINTNTGGGQMSSQQTPTGPSAQELAINASRNAFNSAYDPIFAQLDEWTGLLPTQQAKKEADLQGLYTSQQGELGTNMQGSLGSLDAAGNVVLTQKAQSIRDLQQQMNQMSKAGGMQLGSAGAGDSSAARMYNFALSKAAGQNSADVSNQANSQLGQIQAQGQQIRATFDDQMAKLNTWKAEQTGAITDWADGLLNQIRQSKIGAIGQKAAALAANETGIINNALTQIQKIDDQITSWNEGIQQWALNRMTTLDDAKVKMSGFGKYTPQSITTNELQGLNNIQGADSGGMTGFYNSQKKKETDFLSNYR